jgi:hypothetical protein
VDNNHVAPERSLKFYGFWILQIFQPSGLLDATFCVRNSAFAAWPGNSTMIFWMTVYCNDTSTGWPGHRSAASVGENFASIMKTIAVSVNLGTVWPAGGKSGGGPPHSKTLARGSRGSVNAKRFGVRQSSGALST